MGQSTVKHCAMTHFVVCFGCTWILTCAFSSAMKQEAVVIVSPIASINHANRYGSKLDTPKLDG